MIDQSERINYCSHFGLFIVLDSNTHKMPSTDDKEAPKRAVFVTPHNELPLSKSRYVLPTWAKPLTLVGRANTANHKYYHGCPLDEDECPYCLSEIIPLDTPCKHCSQIVCKKCLFEVDNVPLCIKCITKCELSSCTNAVSLKDSRLCKICYGYVLREIDECMLDSSRLTIRMAQNPRGNYKILLKRPLIERPITSIFKRMVSWDFVVAE